MAVPGRHLVFLGFLFLRGFRAFFGLLFLRGLSGLRGGMGGMLTAVLPGLPGCSGVYRGIYSASWLSPRSTVSGAAGAVGGGCDGGW
jgi:hypothetical protein